MPDLQNHTVTRTGSSIAVSIPVYNISGEVIDSMTGAVLKTYNVNFPQILNQASQAQLEQLLGLIVRAIITAVTGL